MPLADGWIDKYPGVKALLQADDDVLVQATSETDWNAGDFDAEHAVWHRVGPDQDTALHWLSTQEGLRLVLAQTVAGGICFTQWPAQWCTCGQWRLEQ